MKGMGTNVAHRIRNQQISLNSLSMTPSKGVDENHSRGTFCIPLECVREQPPL